MTDIISEILILVAFILGFYLGKNRTLNATEKIGQVKNVLFPPKQYGTPFVIDIDEAEVEKRGIKEEKEIISVADAIKFNENAQNN